MIGLGKMWKAVAARERTAPAERPVSTIPRDIMAPKQAVVPAWEDDDAAAGESDTRGAERFVPSRTHTVLTTASGKRVAARIINISQTGVALEAELSGFGPEDVTTVGSRPVVPGRRISLGMVFLFRKPLDPKLCNPDIVL